MQGIAHINGNEEPQAPQDEHAGSHGEHYEKDAGVMKVSEGRRRHETVTKLASPLGRRGGYIPYRDGMYSLLIST